MPYVTLRRRAAATTAAAVLAAVALAGPASASLAPVGSAPSPYLPAQGSGSDPTAQGIIMSDGRICDPIRHMGC
jgi:anti-sigma factor RsiW